jgi:hypothetical protein
LRSAKQGEASPDEQLAASLGKISTEIDSVTRQLAEGSIDKLAIQTRFLDYKYGGDEVSGDRRKEDARVLHPRAPGLSPDARAVAPDRCA